LFLSIKKNGFKILKNFSLKSPKNVYQLKIVWAHFILVLEGAPGLPPQLDPPP